MKATEIPSIRFSAVLAADSQDGAGLPRTIFSRLVGQAPRGEIPPGGGPECGVGPALPAGKCSKEKLFKGKAKKSRWARLNPPLPTASKPSPTGLLLRPHRPPEQRAGATLKLPPLDSSPPWGPMGGPATSPLDATEANAWGHVQVPLVPPSFFNTGLFLSTELLTVPTRISNCGPPAPPWRPRVSEWGRWDFCRSSKLNFQLANWELQEGNFKKKKKTFLNEIFFCSYCICTEKANNLGFGCVFLGGGSFVFFGMIC